MRISDWSSDVCSSDLLDLPNDRKLQQLAGGDVEVFFLREIGADYVGKISIEYLAENLDLVGKLSRPIDDATVPARSEEHTSELQSLMRISYAVFCLKKKKSKNDKISKTETKLNKRT